MCGYLHGRGVGCMWIPRCRRWISRFSMKRTRTRRSLTSLGFHATRFPLPACVCLLLSSLFFLFFSFLSSFFFMFARAQGSLSLLRISTCRGLMWVHLVFVSCLGGGRGCTVSAPRHPSHSPIQTSFLFIGLLFGPTSRLSSTRLFVSGSHLRRSVRTCPGVCVSGTRVTSSPCVPAAPSVPRLSLASLSE